MLPYVRVCDHYNAPLTVVENLIDKFDSPRAEAFLLESKVL